MVVVSFVLPVAILGERLWEFTVAGEEKKKEERQDKKNLVGGG